MNKLKLPISLRKSKIFKVNDKNLQLIGGDINTAQLTGIIQLVSICWNKKSFPNVIWEASPTVPRTMSNAISLML